MEPKYQMTAEAVWFYVELAFMKLMSIDWKRNKNMQIFNNYSRVIRNSTTSRRIKFRLFPPALCRILAAATVAGSLALVPSAAEGQDGAAVSVSVTAPGPNPASLGSNVTVSATGSPTAPSDPNCEITITSTNWSWSNTLGGTATNDDTAHPSWTIPATSCGANNGTISVTVWFYGTSCDNSQYEASATGSANYSFTVVGVSTTNWTAVCPTLINTPSLSPPTNFCQPYGSAPTIPSNTPPAYSSGLELQIVSNTCSGVTTNQTIVVIDTPGPLLWQIGTNTGLTSLPLLTNTNGLTASAYVIVTNNDTIGLCPAPGRVDLGTAHWCILTVTTNCTNAGSVNLTNTSTATNFSVSTGGSLSVMTNVTNALVLFTTNCPCDSSLSGTFTSNAPPVIISTWWTVSGPGTYTNHGGGLSTGTITPTNGGIGTATFYVSYTAWTNSAAPTDTNVFTNSLPLVFNVIQISNVCEATFPTNQQRTSLGVGEIVDLSLVGAPSGTYSWATTNSTSPNLAGSLNLNSGPAVKFTAPSNAASVTVSVSYSGGTNTISFAIFEPAANSGVIRSKETWMAAGTEGAGMEITVTVLPSTTNAVSFSRVWLLEVGKDATNATGYFADGNTNHAPISHIGNGADTWFLLDGSNNWPHLGQGTGTNYDTADMYNYPSPWTQGSFQWPIPGQWKVDAGGKVNTNWISWSQTMEILDTNGTSKVSKFSLSVQRGTNGVYTP